MCGLCNKNGAYVDPLMEVQGHDQIDALIAGVHGQFLSFRPHSKMAVLFA